MKTKTLARAVAGLCASLALLPAAQAVDWSYTQVVLPGTGAGTAYGLNNLGQVYGSYADPAGTNTTYGFYTGANGVGLTTLNPLGGKSISVRSMNDAGVAVGISDTATASGLYSSGYVPRAFVVQPGQATSTELPMGTLANIQSSYAYGINNAGQVVAATGDGFAYASVYYLTDAAGSSRLDIRTANGASQALSAAAINGSGQVAGSLTVYNCAKCGPVSSAYVTGPNGVGITNLGTLGGGRTNASAVNDRGQVAGSGQMNPYSTDPMEPYHAFIAGPDIGGIRDLGTLGGARSFASDIDNLGRVVGRAELASGVLHAFITGADGIGLYDLNDFAHLSDGSYFSDALGINEVGQVLAQSSTGKLYLLRPVPEPSTYALVGLGLLAAGAVARRRAAA